MGNQSDLKALRSQMRQIVKEFLPEMQKEVLFTEILDVVTRKLKDIEKETRETIEKINERHKDTMLFLTKEMVKIKREASDAKPEGSTNE